MNWEIAIISSRESVEVLSKTVSAVMNAVGEKGATVDLLINGRPVLKYEVELLLGTVQEMRPDHCRVRIWHIAAGDKANAVNRYLHDVSKGSGTVYFIDGYCRPHPSALAKLDEALQNAPDALAATGVPTSGRSAAGLRETMLKSGGIHGNLFAIRASAANEFKERNIRLPSGLYKTDGTIGAIIAFKFDPASEVWDQGRIVVVPEATWEIPTPRRLGNQVLGTLNRKRRQAQGRVENLAIRDLFSIRRQSCSSLPATVTELVRNWTLNESRHRVIGTFIRDPYAYLAYRQVLGTGYGHIAESELRVLADSLGVGSASLNPD